MRELTRRTQRLADLAAMLAELLQAQGHARAAEAAQIRADAAWLIDFARAAADHLERGRGHRPSPAVDGEEPPFEVNTGAV